MSEPKRLDDLFDLPESVHAGDFVLVLGEEDRAQQVLDNYVVTPDLARCFDAALALIKKAVTTQSSKATYLTGSFGSGKSHFMAVLREILKHNPSARGKHGLVDTVASHGSWLEGRKFFQVTKHMIDATSLEDAVFGGYVKAVREAHPEAPLPAVYRDDFLLKDAAALRSRMGDAAFIADLPAPSSEEAAEWGDLAEPWTEESLDAAFAAPAGAKSRADLVSALISVYFTGFTALASGEESYIDLDTGLSVISHHAKALGYDAIVLLLDELVLWQSKWVDKPTELKNQAQKVSKLVESAEMSRPAPIISFLPRQRDLRELVGRDAAGTGTESLFDTLKYWDGRFDKINLADTNLPAVVAERLLKPKSAEAAAALATAFGQAQNNRSRPEVWDVLLDSQGGRSTVADFEATYPFSPAFMHTIVDVSSALQRERTALKLLMQLLVDHRDMALGPLMPLGTIFEVLVQGEDTPFTDRLRTEFERIKSFYMDEVRPFLLDDHKLTEETAQDLPPRHAFRADDMVVKTLMIAALVPKVPALSNLTASRLAALNQGAIAAPIPGTEKQKVARTLKKLNTEFGAFQVVGKEDPQVTVQLLEVDVKSILASARGKSGDKISDRKRAIKKLLWKALELGNPEPVISNTSVTWRGTTRQVEVLWANIRQTPQAELYSEEPDRLRLVVDYPFDDEASFGPADDRIIIDGARLNFSSGDAPLAICWLPAFFTEERLTDLANFVTIEYVLAREDRLIEAGPNLSGEDRAEARMALGSQRTGLEERLIAAMKQAYGVNRREPTDIEEHPCERVMSLDARWKHEPQPGAPLADAMKQMVRSLFDYTYPDHPDLGAGSKDRAYKRAELDVVWRTVEAAAKDPNKRAEISKADREVLKRIAAPLEIGTVNEGSMVLPERWRGDLNLKASATEKPEEVTVSRVRDWIIELKPGLPKDVVDMLVLCFAIEDDRTWIRAGATMDAPPLSGLTADMRLRKQRLPDEAVFKRAAERAVGIFGAERRPAFNSRSVAAMSRKIRMVLHQHGQAVSALHDGLVAHATTLGLDESSPRLATAAALAELFKNLGEADGDLDLFERLARPELPRDLGIYARSVNDSGSLESLLNDDPDKWTILDRLVSDSTAGAALILDRLRAAATVDQHNTSLGPVIRDCLSKATNLFLGGPNPPPPPPPPPWPNPDTQAGSGDDPRPPTNGGNTKTTTLRRRASGAKLKRIFPDLALQDGEYEVTITKVVP
jgi:hypothetical protein